MPLQPGQTVAHYRIERKLGEGGMGVIWTAEDTKLKRRIALKELPEAMAADPDRRARFEREARAVAALNHPNIVTLHSVEEANTESGPVHFITMELVEGKTLTELLPAGGFDLDRMLEIAIPLADAVSWAHRAGITHRDLKPDNIMIDDDGRLRVLDFGLAKLGDRPECKADTEIATVTSDTAEGHILGTVAYMSPEQAEGKPVDARSDVFSLGTILYEMVSGERPFQGDTRMSTIGAILKDEPASITETKSSLPRHAGRIIRRCLAKDPERRYQTAIDLRNELEELKADVQSGIHTTDTNTAPSSEANRRGLIALGILAVVAVVALVVILRPWQRQPVEPAARSYSVVPLTSGLGLELAPTWSPNGEFLAFAEVRNGSVDIVVKPMAGGEPVVRAGGPGDETAPSWSPDGQYLAYVSTSEPGTPVYLVPPHGGAKKKLIDTGFPRAGIVHLRALGHNPWSADGRTVLISLANEAMQSVIHRVNLDTGTAEPLITPPPGLNDHGASYSPDGQHVVFTRGSIATQFGDTMIMPAGGGEPELLIEKAAFPAYRPDGHRLLFNRTLVDQPGNLWELDLETGKETQLTHEAVHTIISFGVSSTNRIAYQSFWHDTFLYTVDVESGERVQLTSHTKENFRARFAPGGDAIAYSSTRDGDWDIYLLPLEGGPETRVTNRDGTDDYPDWSPQGTQLVYFADQETSGSNVRVRKQSRQLTVVNRDGGGARVLTDQPGFGQARWSPSGERIGYVALQNEIPALWTIKPDGTDAKAVHPLVGLFDWYVDDRRGIYAFQKGTETELFAVDLETGETQSLFVGPFVEFDVSPDGSMVALVMGDGHLSLSLVLLRLSSEQPGKLPSVDGEPEVLIQAEGTWHIHLGGWSADSKQIVYTRDQDYGDLFELVEN